jgi:hypothetical protein
MAILDLSQFAVSVKIVLALIPAGQGVALKEPQKHKSLLISIHVH